MRVAELTAYHARIPLRRKIRHASHVRTVNDTLIVRARMCDGTLGWGEGLPRRYVTGETIESTFQQLSASDLRAALSGSISGLGEAVERCRQLELSGAPCGSRDCFGNATRCAIELALLDAVCRVEKLPLAEVTQHVPEANAIRRATDVVRYSAALTSLSPRRQWIQAWKLRLYGFHQIKVKVGTAGIDDARLLARVRRVVGPQVDLRLDANEAWTCENLEEKLQPLVRLGITSLEQPVPHGAIDGLVEIRPRIPTPIMLDESLCSPGDGRRAIERRICDLFNIRLSKCGGFIPSLLLASMSHQAGLGFQLGCQVGETGILSAAGRHFACSVGGIRFLEGSYDRHLVRERLTRQDVTFGRGGFAPVLPGPGLGVDVDESAVLRVSIREERFAMS